jgi:flagellum-specific peptidoglycan hydrolase FlgJ
MKKIQEYWPLLLVFLGYLLYRRRGGIVNWNPLLQASKHRKWADIIVAQAKHETGNFTSPNYKNYNNAFGMGCAKIRPSDYEYCRITTINGKKHEYAVYKNPEQSFKDLLLYLDYNRLPNFDSVQTNKVEYYVTWLKQKGYYTASYQEYLNGVKSFLK